MIGIDTDGPVRAVFTTRDVSGDLGATGGASDPAAVRVRRRTLCADLGLDADRVVMGHQVHGASVRRVDAPTRPGRFTGGLLGWPEGDGLTTATPGVALVVLGADCLPVLMWRRDAPHIAAAHAGWRGLAAGVVEETVRALGGTSSVSAVVGPGIGPCCFVTGSDVREVLARRFGDPVVRGDGVDLAEAARRALCASGVAPDSITTVPACTSCEPARFYSYRRDGGHTGRQAGVIWIDRGDEG